MRARGECRNLGVCECARGGHPPLITDTALVVVARIIGRHTTWTIRTGQGRGSEARDVWITWPGAAPGCRAGWPPPTSPAR